MVKAQSKKVSQAEVIKALKRADGTGDPDWVDELANRVLEYPQWQLTSMSLDELPNARADMDEDDAQDYLDALSTLPPIVVVPSDDFLPFKYEILDGAHRAGAAIWGGLKHILAYVPDIRSNPASYELERLVELHALVQLGGYAPLIWAVNANGGSIWVDREGGELFDPEAFFSNAYTSALYDAAHELSVSMDTLQNELQDSGSEYGDQVSTQMQVLAAKGNKGLAEYKRWWQKRDRAERKLEGR